MKPQLTTSTSATPVLVAALGILILTIMDGSIKGVSARHATVEIAFGRFSFGLIFAVLAALVIRPGWPSMATLRAHLTRTFFVVSTAFLFFYSVSVLPLAEAITISFLSPSLVALLGRFILHEKVSPLTWVSIGVSFFGVVIIAHDDLSRSGGQASANLLGIAAALGAAVTYAVSLVLLRARTASDHIATIVLMQNSLAALYLLPFVMTFGSPLNLFTGGDWTAFLAIGAMGTTGHLLLAWAYSQAAAARIGAVDYSALLWSVAIGILAFNEWPSQAVLIGASFIIGGSGVLLLKPKTHAAPVEME